MSEDIKSKKNNMFITLGASNHTDKEREVNDFYATEPRAIEVLCEVETFDGLIWECACGQGHMSEELKKHGYTVISSDLIDRGYGDTGIDFLQYFPPDPTLPFMGNIITNPPFKYAEQFVKKALDLVQDGKKVAMLLKIQFLEGKNRKKLFIQYPPRTVYVSSSRLLCAKNAEFKKMRANGGSVLCYAWYIWEKGFTGTTELKWIN